MFELTPFTRRNDIRNFGGFDPWRDMQHFEREFFGDQEKAFKTDIKDEGDHYLLEAELPGFEKENIKVSVEDGYMTITAERNSSNEEKKENGHYLRREFSFAKFQQTMLLPDDAVRDNISAKMENGVLTVNIPKEDKVKEENRNRMIEIK